MLTINLLPHKKQPLHTDNKKQILLFILILILIGTGLLQVRQMLTSKIERLHQEKDRKLTVQHELQKKLTTIQAIKKEFQGLDQRIVIIRKIRSQQTLPIRYLDVIANHVPANKMWFESFSMDSNGRITLSGIALDNQVFARYLKKLRSSKRIADISLQQTQRKSIQRLDLVAFRCSITAAHPPDKGDSHG
jgi:type IV pilus assembly protein PilN